MLGTTLVLSTLLVPFGALGCERSADRAVISREEYVETYVELLLAQNAAADSLAAADSARAVLQRRGVTPEDLRAFNERYVDDPGYLSNVWLQIETRLRNPEAADTADREL